MPPNNDREGQGRHFQALGVSLQKKYHAEGDVVALTHSITAFRKAADSYPDSQVRYRSASLHSAGTGLLLRHEHSCDLADIDDAIEVLQEAVGILPERRREDARLYTALGDAFRTRFSLNSEEEDFRSAMLAFEQAFACRPKLNDRSGVFYGLGNVLHERFLIYRLAVDLDRSISCFRDAISLIPEGADKSYEMHDLGVALLDRYEAMDRSSPADLNEALEMFERAAKSTENVAFRTSVLVNWHQALTEKFNRSGDSGDERRIAEVLDLISKRGMASEPLLLFDVAVNQFTLAKLRKDWPATLLAFDQLVALAELILGLQLTHNNKDVWMVQWEGLAADAAYAAVNLGRILDAALILENNKTRVLRQRLDRDSSQLDSLAALGHSELIAQYQTASENLRRLEGVYADIDTPDSRDRHALLNARVSFEQVIGRIREVSGCRDFLRQVDARLLFEAASSMPLVYLAAGHHGGIAVIVSANEPVRAYELAELTNDALDEQMFGQNASKTYITEAEAESRQLNEGYLNAYERLRAGATNSKFRWSHTMDMTCAWLWRAVMRPLFAVLPDSEKICLVPIGSLAFLPLHAAWTKDASASSGRKYVNDFVSIKYAPSALLLANATRDRNPSSKEGKLLCVLDPKPVNAPDLAGTLAEASFALEQFEHRKLIQHEAASCEDVLKSISEYEVVHFACHGAWEPTKPLESGLLMSNDEVLSVGKLLGLRRTVGQVAILSACESGIPSRALPDEGVSFPAGFMCAGFSAVVATLWSVEDLSTALLMIFMYDFWCNTDRDLLESLTTAQRWLRRSSNMEKIEYLDLLLAGRNLGYDVASRISHLKVQLSELDPAAHTFEHPLHWAAFSYTGA